MSPTPANSPPKKSPWTFLSNHAHVLVCLARDPDSRLRDIAEQVGITERAVFKIVTELEESGVITRSKEGRRNHYAIDPEIALRHPLEENRNVGCLLRMLLETSEIRRLGISARKKA